MNKAPRYRGAAWRSRFLKAPKIALRLAERDDFVAVNDLATISLGIKTGADRFFFLRRLKDKPVGALAGADRGKIWVEGFEDWRGRVAGKDLVPAIVGPHDLLGEGRRKFRVPRTTERLYLQPRGRAGADLAHYVSLGEIAGLPKSPLVAQNASTDWWRQERNIVRAPWALPYNSAYDYGAWDNSVGAVLNGRFVGVTPRDGVCSDLLGAALNSTFAMVGRLLEGMATGTEGALDVGPPAVRLIQVPDVRALSGDAADEVRAVLAQLRREDSMPSAPDARGLVVQQRRDLDLSLLRGLGLSAGEATALLEELYNSYGRWRADVEGVERDTQVNRRAMAQSGQIRSVKPAIAAGRRVWEELAGNARLLPTALLMNNDGLEVVKLPAGAPLAAHEPLIDPGLITNGRQTVDLKQHSRVRYAAMLKRIGFEGELLVLTDPVKAGVIADRFEEDLESVREEATRRASAYVNRELIAEAVAVALDCWLKACRRGGMVVEAPSDVEPTLEAHQEASRRARIIH
jgi:hypothetical protein